jgi:3-oxoacyl-[acyl-carrier-protein] synthase III
MLTVTHAAVAWPSGRADAAAWTRASRDTHRRREVARESDVGAFLGLSDLMFDEVRLRPLDVLEDAQWTDPTPVAAATETQAELAGRALGTLAGTLGPSVLAKCRAILYLTSSVDREFFQSSVVRLAAAHGMHKVPHWGLGQLQGTSLPVALDVANSLLINNDMGVLVIAAEAWPMPLPRAIAGTTVLCDGAVALWVTASAAASGLRVTATEQRSFDPFVSIEGRRIEVDEAAMLDAAAATITQTLRAAGLSASDVVIRHSELRPGLDAALCRRLGLDPGPDGQRSAAWTGWACAAAAPRQLAEMLAPATRAEPRPVLLWNLSLAGAAGAVLLHHTAAEGHA